MIRDLVALGSEFTLIRKGQELVKEYMMFKECSIYLLESSTDTLISISEEKIAQAIKLEKAILKQDPRIFKRFPKNVGLVGMVLRENKMFTSDYFTEAMLYDEDWWKISLIKNSNKPCSVLCVPIQWEIFPHAIGVIQLVDKLNSKPISSKDIDRVIALKNLFGSLIENICRNSSIYKTMFRVQEIMLSIDELITQYKLPK